MLTKHKQKNKIKITQTKTNRRIENRKGKGMIIDIKELKRERKYFFGKIAFLKNKAIL